MTVKLLEEVLPLDISPSSVYHSAQQVSLRLEKELGDEQIFFVEGCPYEESVFTWILKQKTIVNLN
ncbi:MAG: hypothetical protein A3F67_00360 [Verrucomicrobia bacterium RIFCSPHIGHO2_12_FULL_41_10]|nr:MAG: hypothetical protein A3F67_00360 [Verrucomicrobia bacterium RIFCSPHIGHO2_12_FULL_41_10]